MRGAFANGFDADTALEAEAMRGEQLLILLDQESKYMRPARSKSGSYSKITNY
jgi:hypothetical protein